MPDPSKEDQPKSANVYSTYQQFRDRFYKEAENQRKRENDSADLASFGKQLAREILKQK